MKLKNHIEELELKVFEKGIKQNEKINRKIKEIYKKYNKKFKNISEMYLNKVEVDNKVIESVNYKDLDKKINEEKIDFRNEIRKETKKTLEYCALLSILFYKGTKKEFIHSGYKVRRPERKILNEIINSDYLGRNIRERTYNLAEDLGARAQSMIKSGIKNKQSPRVIAQNLQEQLNINYNNAITISRTESTRVYNYAKYKEIMEDDNVRDVIIIATLDKKTSEICRKKDQKIIRKENITQDKIPPFHPNCRSTITTYFGSGDIKTRLDNREKKLKEYMDFKTFEKKYLKI